MAWAGKMCQSATQVLLRGRGKCGAPTVDIGSEGGGNHLCGQGRENLRPYRREEGVGGGGGGGRTILGGQGDESRRQVGRRGGVGGGGGGAFEPRCQDGDDTITLLFGEGPLASMGQG